ncbi:ScbA/BarX family gamma-butyrolactone biosynthesis protein [Kitasatospora brasiliensis]|uniref:ScbA/BarX family gamma-butyrolactone biosynthesis protein n=1 Tax=Kitasatospora brasiliensis TaxID=3058040 RepID=UPI00292FD5EA|nr:ScbA/BarX family gamma-butyrolactone biosynthesis protein [Kitasatospora sp. K002]
MPVCEELQRTRPEDVGHPRATATVSTCDADADDAVPVEPWQVHKLRSDEVYLTGWHRTGPDAFRILARRPQEHPLYRVRSEFDPLLLCETVRQTFPLLCHAAYEVPPGHQLTWGRFRYDLDDAAFAGVDRGSELELAVLCSELSYRRGHLAGLSLRAEVSWGGVRVAVAETRFTVQSRAVYQRLRGGYADAEAAMASAGPAPAPVPCAGTGRTRPRDVVLAPAAGGVRRLRVDPGHPVYFDHPVDHVPGALLLEAVHQSAGRAVRTLECTFHRFVEFDAPCTIVTAPLDPEPGRARRDDDGSPAVERTRITAVQGGQTRFTADLVHRVAPAREGSVRAAR